MREVVDVLLGLTEHLTPLRLTVIGVTQPEEGQGRRIDDGGGKHKRRLDDHRPEGVGQHVPQHDGAGTHAEGASREHVIARPLGKHGAAQEPGKHRQVGHRDGDDDGHLARLRRKGGDRDGQQQGWHREHDVDGAHDQGVDPAAEGAREGAKDEPSGEREEGGEDTDIQRLLAADDQAGEQVSATRVGAQGVARLRARDGVGLGADLVEEVADGRVVRGDPRSDQGKQDEGRGDDKADEEDGIAAQPAPGAGDEGHPGRVVDPSGFADRFGECVDLGLAARGTKAAGALGGSLAHGRLTGSARVGR